MVASLSSSSSSRSSRSITSCSDVTCEDREPSMRLAAPHLVVYRGTLLDIMSGKTSHPDTAAIHPARRIMRILGAEICFLFPAHLLGFHILYTQSNIRRPINVAFRMQGNDSEIKTELRRRLNKYDKAK